MLVMFGRYFVRVLGAFQGMSLSDLIRQSRWLWNRCLDLDPRMSLRSSEDDVLGVVEDDFFCLSDFFLNTR